MEVRREKEMWLVRLEKGEKVKETLAEFAREHYVKGAKLSAIGAVDWAELAYFDEEKQAYENKTFSGGLEVLNLAGNISWVDDETPMVHLHATLGKEDYNVVGGHLNEALVSVTIEAFVLQTEAISRQVPFGPFKLWHLG